MDEAQSSNDYRRVLLGLPHIDSWPISRWIRPSYEEMNGYRRWVRRAEAVGELALGGPDWDVTVALMNEIDEEPYSSIVKLASLKRISECLGTREAGEISKAFARSLNHPSPEFLKDPKIVDWAISLFHCVSQVFRLRDSSDNLRPQEVEEWVTDAEQYLQFLLTLSPSDDHSGPTAGPQRVVGADSFLEYKNVLLGLPYVNSWPIPEGTFEAIGGEYYDKWVRSSETLGELSLAGPSWDVVAVSMLEIDEPFASVVKLAALKKLSQCLGTSEAGQITWNFACSLKHDTPEFVKDRKIVDWAISLYRCVIETFKLSAASMPSDEQPDEDWMEDEEGTLQFLLNLKSSSKQA